MNRDKLFFFDIDGTLLDMSGQMQESAKRALRQLKHNGHGILIASGRTRPEIPETIVRFGFDGMVLGNGSYAEYGGKVLRSEILGDKTAAAIIEYLYQNRALIMASTPEGVYMTAKTQEYIFRRLLCEAGKVGELAAEMRPILVNKEQFRNLELVIKIIYMNLKTDRIDLIRRFSDVVTVMPNSIHSLADAHSGEIVKKGINKAAGIAVLLQHLGRDFTDVVTFGDGINDIEMLQEAALGIAMENGAEAAKKAADYITGSIADHGIERALKYYKYI